jgi:hypothetical protein
VPSLEQLSDPQYRPPKGPPCTVATILAGMDDATADRFRAAMDNPHAPSTDIARAVTDMGHPIRSYGVQRHRRRECRCSA